MPDITMCQSTCCPQKHTCFRFCATPSVPWQSYADFYDDDEAECEYHIPLSNPSDVHITGLYTNNE